MWNYIFLFCTKKINDWILPSLTSPCALFWQENKYGRYPSQLEKEMLQNKRWSDFVIWMENDISIVVLICHFAYSTLLYFIFQWCGNYLYVLTLLVPFFIAYSTFSHGASFYFSNCSLHKRDTNNNKYVEKQMFKYKGQINKPHIHKTVVI